MSEAQIEYRFNRRILDAITQLELKAGHFVPLKLVRRDLYDRGIPAEIQDRHFRRMSRQGLLHFAPDGNRKALTVEDHRAALDLGGDPKHLVARAEQI